MSCPACQSLAARPGEWDKLHISEKHGEGVACSCGVMLFASPDDDLDPVKPGEPYDQAVYHRFVRPADWSAKRHRVVLREVRVGDWVTIRGIRATVTARPDATLGEEQDLDGGEARVVALDNDRAHIALSGNTGIGGSSEFGGSWAWVPLTSIRPMALPTLVVGDSVRVTRGVFKGAEGTVIAMTRGVIELRLTERHLLSGTTTAKVIVEHIEKTEQTTLI